MEGDRALRRAGRARPAYDGFYNRCAKRVIDAALSGAALALVWPLLLAIAAAIVADTGFPVFYRAPRGGYRGRPFRICKFRTMVRGADRMGGGTTALHDARITRVGAFLRKTKMDELPQLAQVLAGKMSLVGPRPELLKYVERYSGEERCILEVRPGITDYASVELINLDEIVGEGDADRAYEERVLKRKNALRVKYAESVSFRTDAAILARTAGAVIGKACAYAFRGEHR